MKSRILAVFVWIHQIFQFSLLTNWHLLLTLDLYKKGKMPLKLLHYSFSHYRRRKLEENDETKHCSKPGFN